MECLVIPVWNQLSFLDLSSFNTKNVKDMHNMFSSCIMLKSIVLSSFDTTNVSNMNCMFQSDYNLISLDLSSFNTINLESMYKMFENLQSLHYLDISNWVWNSYFDNNILYDLKSSSNPGIIKMNKAFHDKIKDKIPTNWEVELS